jgi:hypothetical protein
MALLAHTGDPGNTPFGAGLRLLGVSLTDVNGKAKTTSQVLNDILHRLAGIQDPQKRAYEGAMVLGSAYQSWAFALDDGEQGLDK